MVMTELPEGWKETSINNLIGTNDVFIDGDWIESKDQDPNGEVRLIQLADLKEFKFVEKSNRHLTYKKAIQLGCTFLKKDDVLVARMPDPMGRACLFPFDKPESFVTVVDVAIIRINPNFALPRWLMYFVNAPEFRSSIIENSGGSTRQRISRKNLGQLELPLPPLPEQKRIVAKLDTLFAHLDQLKARLQNIPTLLKQFRQTVLTQAVTGKLYKSKSTWKNFTLGDLANEGGVFDGPFGSNLKTLDYTAEGVRVIRLENIEHLHFVEEKETYISDKKYQTLLRHTINQGDLIFSSFISEEIRACIIPKLRTQAIAKADCFCIRPKAHLVNKKFLLYSMVSDSTYAQLSSRVHGSTRPRINTTQLKQLALTLPDINEQEEIVRKVESLFSAVDRIEASYKTLQEKIDYLPQAILSKAFRGELVVQEVTAKLKTYATELKILNLVVDPS